MTQRLPGSIYLEMTFRTIRDEVYHYTIQEPVKPAYQYQILKFQGYLF